jgi:hypothetical protein
MGGKVAERDEKRLLKVWQSSIIIENVFLIQRISGKPGCFNGGKPRVLVSLCVVSPE